jgi:hypothetical protein
MGESPFAARLLPGSDEKYFRGPNSDVDNAKYPAHLCDKHCRRADQHPHSITDTCLNAHPVTGA